MKNRLAPMRLSVMLVALFLPVLACSSLGQFLRTVTPSSIEDPGWPAFADLQTGTLGGKILHCSGPLFWPEHHDAYLAAFPETKPIAVRADVNIGESRFTIDQLVDRLAENFGRYPREIPLLTILYIKSDPSGKSGLGREVLAGEYDEALEKLAALVRSFDKPVLVRLAPEFNGAWSGYHHEFFARSFRYIVELFRREGVANAVYLWNYMPQPHAFPYEDWYPGDDVVDWWSVDIFSVHFQDAAANGELRRFLADAADHGKPVFVPESGPSTEGVADAGVWDTWFVPFFTLINEDPHIKGFCYSNEDFRLTTTAPDWRNVMLQDSPIKPFYAEELKKPQYWNQPAEE